MSIALPENLTWCELPSWSAIIAQGQDAKSYLQGQLSCNVPLLEKNKSTFGAQCDAQGKTISIFRLFHHQASKAQNAPNEDPSTKETPNTNSYALFQRKSTIELALASIKKYAVFSKITLEETSAHSVGIIGDLAEQAIDLITQATSDDVRAFAFGTAVKVAPQRWLLLIEADKKDAFFNQYQFPTARDESLWQQQEMLDAYPHIEAKDQLQHIPQALNLQALDGISFNKGCYTGQETIARAKYRGINKRGMFILKGEWKSELAKELNDQFVIERQVGENWRSAGEFLAYNKTGDQLIGLAVLPNNLESDTKFRLQQQPEMALSFGALPYLVDAES